MEAAPINQNSNSVNHNLESHQTNLKFSINNQLVAEKVYEPSRRPTAIKNQILKERQVRSEIQQQILQFKTYTAFLWYKSHPLSWLFPKKLRLVRPSTAGGNYQFINYFGRTILQRTEQEFIRDLRRNWLVLAK